MGVNLEVLQLKVWFFFPDNDETEHCNSNPHPEKVNSSSQPYQVLRAPAANDLPSPLNK